MTTDILWTAADLAAYLGLAESTVKAFSSRAPQKLPPRVLALSSHRWVPSVCRAWAEAQSGHGRRKGGRPRQL